MDCTNNDSLYRIHKLLLWMLRDSDFHRLMSENELLRSAYNDCITYYHRIDFLDLENDSCLSERKLGIYGNMILTSIQRLPNPTDEFYKATVRENYKDFIKLALKQ